MKKLLTLAAVVCMATFAQALSLSWSSNTDVSAWPSVTASLVYSATGNNLTDAALLANGYDAIISTDGFSVDYDKTTKQFTGIVGDDAYTQQATSGTYFLVFTATGTDTAYVSAFDAGAAYKQWFVTGMNPPKESFAINTFTAVTVPEPTVMALLALGVAGVALRRRRRA